MRERWIGRRRRYKCYYPISFFLQKVQFCSCVVLSVLTLRRVAWQFDTIKQLLRFRACRSGELASASLVVRVRLFANWKFRAIAIFFLIFSNTVNTVVLSILQRATQVGFQVDWMVLTLVVQQVMHYKPTKDTMMMKIDFLTYCLNK